MQKVCANPWCRQAFEVTNDDLAFYEKVSPIFNGRKELIPTPMRCPECRRQQRISFRNFFHLHHATCALSGKKILSMYAPTSPFPIYGIQEWWSDKWDALDYGRELDLNRPLLQQIHALHQAVPRMSIYNIRCENTDYCNFSFQSRNCYLIGGNVGNEDCYYGHIVWQSRNCLDNLYIYKCELCYECIDCFQCFNTTFSRACENCSDSNFLVHCMGCKNCFGCVGLKNVEYHLFNQRLTKEEYKKRLREFRSDSHKMIDIARQKVQELIGREVVKYYHGLNCENVSGDYLYNCKNLHHCFDTKNCEDCSYLATAESFINCHDCNYSPNRTEWSYNCLTCTGNGFLACHNVHDSSNMAYSEFCSNCEHCFGCEGLRRKKYCILNKQYTEEEYNALMPKIIEKMKADGEWGEFFSITMSPFAYNKTIAQEYFPLTKEEVLKRGWHWRDEKDEIPKVEKIIPAERLPDSIDDIPDDVLNWAIKCEATGRPFKIVKQELAFYRKMKLPIPHLHPDERHKRRMALRNPRKLWQRKCMKCGKEIETTYQPSRPEIVYCEECYLKTVY